MHSPSGILWKFTILISRGNRSIVPSSKAALTHLFRALQTTLNRFTTCSLFDRCGACHRCVGLSTCHTPRAVAHATIIRVVAHASSCTALVAHATLCETIVAHPQFASSLVMPQVRGLWLMLPHSKAAEHYAAADWLNRGDFAN